MTTLGTFASQVLIVTCDKVEDHLYDITLMTYSNGHPRNLYSFADYRKHYQEQHPRGDDGS